MIGRSMADVVNRVQGKSILDCREKTLFPLHIFPAKTIPLVLLPRPLLRLPETLNPSARSQSMPKRRTEPSPSPSPSHGGAFTRSRSEIFLHRTRSGLARPDPAPLRHHLLLRRLSTTSPPPIHGGNLVKDLRLRRVFSPASVSVEEEASPDRTGKIGSGDDSVGEERGQGGVDEISKSFHGSNGFDNSSNESSAPESVVAVDFGIKRGDLKDGDKLDSIDPPKSGSRAPPECVIAVDCSMKSMDSKDDAKLNVIDSPKNTESTPPQCVVAVDLGTANMDRLMKDSQNDINGGVKLDPFSPSKKNLGLAPCSRSKLVRNPSLFSYRRMLPFLTDLDKEENPPRENKNPAEVERIVQEKQLSPPGNLLSDQPPQRSSLGGVSLNEELCTSSDFVDNPSMNSCNGRCLEVSKIESEASLVDPIIEAQLLHKPVCSPPTFSEVFSVQEMAGSAPSTIIVPKEGKADCKNTVPTIDIDRRSIVTSKSDIVHSSERHLLSPKRGILKRHTRGCKGACMCLDCVSFRIHADRAFEFSRKQMQEADETIAGLVKELASLRNLVEKSILPSVGSGSYGILQFTQDLIQGACRRASRAEAIASNRCRQMFNDLNAHCRIPGPRVTFADCVEERKITSPGTNCSKSLEKFMFYGSS
ncbi:uncharacterized protein LOC109725822 isoform X2 [Ananas comosus]|uniref:Uncharacterized protein LOC109725822 isoform X2 n=1 Tax=Ananas comosus TaxID=4615 RepID=A0A6P5GQ59_ANACO|nr:uncharacterized protein LOC109725822 isoform X2 [Ananas comosus]